MCIDPYHNLLVDIENTCTHDSIYWGNSMRIHIYYSILHSNLVGQHNE